MLEKALKFLPLVLVPTELNWIELNDRLEFKKFA